MTTKSSRYDRIVSAILTGATVVAVVLLVEQRLKPPRAPVGQNRVEFLPNWSTVLASSGIFLTDSGAPVKIGVFTDFQCPFCRRMDSILTTVEARFPGKISRAVIHFPIDGHEHATAAAMAFECAVAQGRAAAMHRILYDNQSKLGLVPWSDHARQAGVPNLDAFAGCLTSRAFGSKVDSGSALGRRLSIRGTPTVVVNGWLFDPSFPSTIENAVAAAISGKSPKPRGAQ